MTARDILAAVLMAATIRKRVGRLGCGSVEITLDESAARRLADEQIAALRDAGIYTVTLTPMERDSGHRAVPEGRGDG